MTFVLRLNEIDRKFFSFITKRFVDQFDKIEQEENFVCFVSSLSLNRFLGVTNESLAKDQITFESYRKTHLLMVFKCCISILRSHCERSTCSFLSFSFPFPFSFMSNKNIETCCDEDSKTKQRTCSFGSFINRSVQLVQKPIDSIRFDCVLTAD